MLLRAGVNILPGMENASFHGEMHSLLFDLFILAGEGLKDSNEVRQLTFILLLDAAGHDHSRIIYNLNLSTVVT